MTRSMRGKKSVERPRTRNTTAAMVRQVMTSLAERKRFTVVNGVQTVATAGIVINLTNNIVQGDDISQRSGDKISILKHTLLLRATALVNSQTIRFIWFRDLMNGTPGHTPAVSDVLSTTSYIANYNNTNIVAHRYSILEDVSLNVNLNGEAVKTKVCVDTKRRPVHYNAGTAVATANGPGAVFLLVIGDTSTGAFDFSYTAEFNDS